MKQHLLKIILLTALCVCMAGALFTTLTPKGTAHASCDLYAWTWGTGNTWNPGGLNETITTCAGHSEQFIYQTDGNVVLYCNGNAIWATNTNEIPPVTPAYASFQNDGNFVVYDGFHGVTNATWASNTNNKGAELLVLQRDGNLVIYQGGYTNPLWASHTNGRC